MRKAENFGEKLKTLRESRELKIMDIQRLTGISRTSLYNWEKNVRSPKSVEVFQLLADFFKVPITYFTDNDIQQRIEDLTARVQSLEKKIKDR